MLDGLRFDVGQAVRRIRRSPGFAATVIGTLALGLGANTALFSAVRAVLLRPLPYPEADRVHMLWGENPARGWREFGVSMQDFLDWRERSESFAAMGAFHLSQANLALDDRAERIGYARVSSDLFRVLGVVPALGRLPRPEEDLPGRDAVAVVSHGFWRRALGGDPDAVGREVRLDGRELEVVGVMPEGFAFPDRDVDLWKPFGMEPDEGGSRGSRWLAVAGRLRPDVAPEAAQAELDGIAAALAAEYPDSNRDWIVRAEPLREALVGDVRPALLAVWAAVGLLMLLICANVANLLLGRAAARRRELAVRKALGAGTGRLVREALAEGLLLSLAGALLGSALARAGVKLLAGPVAEVLPRGDTIGVDLSVLAFGLGIAALAGTGFALAPGIAAARSRAADPLRSARGSSEGRREGRLRRGLAVAQVTTAFVVLTGAGLALRSARALQRVDPGFEAERRLSLQIAPEWDRYADRTDAVRFYGELEERLAALPGVAGVAAINVPPLAGGGWWNAGLSIRGRAEAVQDRPSARVRVVTPSWFETMGVPLVAGRTLSPADDASGTPVVVLSRAAAERYWPGGDPLGARLTFGDPADPAARWYAVVGIVDDTRDAALDQSPAPMAYLTLAQARFGHFGDWRMTLTLLAEPGAPVTALAAPARATVAALDPALPVFSVRSVAEYAPGTLAGRRLGTRLLVLFGGLGLVLAATGVYAVLACAVARRTREIGTRMALGASPGRILAHVAAGGAGLAAAGTALGLVGALLGGRLLSGLLYGVQPHDPTTLAAIALLLAAVTLVATLIPGRRAARLQPTEALRAE